MSRIPLLISLLAAMLAGGALHAQSHSKLPTPADAVARYDSLLHRLKGGDTAIDYGALRIAFSQRPGFNAYDDQLELRKPMIEQFRAGKYDSLRYYANAILEKNYVNIEAHILYASASDALGKEAEAAFHNRIALGLVESIVKSGDGRTPATAFIVISVPEEYAVLRAFGLTSNEQGLDNTGGHICDKLSTIDSETSEKGTMYFNVEIPFASMDNTLNKGK